MERFYQGVPRSTEYKISAEEFAEYMTADFAKARFTCELNKSRYTEGMVFENGFIYRYRKEMFFRISNEDDGSKWISSEEIANFDENGICKKSFNVRRAEFKKGQKYNILETKSEFKVFHPKGGYLLFPEKDFNELFEKQRTQTKFFAGRSSSSDKGEEFYSPIKARIFNKLPERYDAIVVLKEAKYPTKKVGEKFRLFINEDGGYLDIPQEYFLRTFKKV
jgi:hypothetical protein